MSEQVLSNKPGRGVLFPQRAEGNRPTRRGGVNIDGVEYELAGWDRTAKGSGKPYISLTIKRLAPRELPEPGPEEPF